MPPDTGEVMDFLRGAGHFAGPALVFAAHPDDETVGASSLLPRLPEVTIVHVTDGAPRDRRWWGAPETASREEYARVRREELRAALALAGISPGRLRTLRLADQEASLDLAGLARRAAEVLRELRPALVLTHPYEGGHPDHDAAAFAMRSALYLLRAEGAALPALVEFASYHARSEGLATCEFLPAAGGEEVEAVLTETERTRKEAMLACFATQRETLARFPTDREQFRAAPAYDFTRPPHAGTLNYERFGWGCTGAEWRARAREALEALGTGEAPC
ncbi:MAG TPA: PIG-L family deacetylase [Longimicrobiaceae bacterium]|nr:PIG-L family deacetylase [Longimicrobiaceae bacterium]